MKNKVTKLLAFFRRKRKDIPQAWRPSWAWEELQNNVEQGEFLAITATGGTTRYQEGVPKDTRKVVKPKDVIGELNVKKPNLDFTNLDERIKAIRKRIDFMEDDLGIEATEEKIALTWLEARKKAVSLGILDEFKWPVTTGEEVRKLLRKYKLEQGSITNYHLAIPAEAIDEMEKYVKLCRKVTKEEVEVFIIADEVEKRDKFRRKDPIIIATSPFGKYFHIIGAWDKEVEILHELFIKNK